ncbi:MAG: DUF6502 family protein [Aliishimia sp.]
MCILHISQISLPPSRKMCILHIMPEVLDSLLAPLARLLVARNVGFPALSERLKGHYVRAATAQATEQGHKVTDSRLSVITGLHRRDIARLRAFEEKRQRPSPLTRLVALWSHDPRYQGRALPRSGPEPSFETLARDVIQDVHPRTLLDTLLEAGTCSDDGDLLHLLTASYVPAVGSDGQVGYLAANVGDHLSGATENVLGQAKAPHFDRALHLSGLTSEQVAYLRDQYETAQMDVLKDLQSQADLLKADGEIKGTLRLRAGGYLYTKDKKEPT